MASSIVSSAARLIAKLLVDEAKHLYAVKDKVEALYEGLIWMHTFLQDADAREHREEIIHMWVSQIREFAYEAEDIVEKYIHKVSNPRQEGCWNTIKWFGCVCCDAKPLHQVGSAIDHLKQRFFELSIKMQIYGVKPISVGSPLHTRRVMELRRTCSHIEREEIVGLHDETRMLAEILTNSNHKAVCISGMGGLGKTTLAKMVYRDIKEVYKNRVWVYVSQLFQVRNILEVIVRKLGLIDDQDCRSISDLHVDELHSKVRQILKVKKCLVVLDDVWNEDDWKELAPAFAELGHSQSKLLVTTRKENLRSRVDCQGYHHKARKLEEEDSWDLLKKIALRGKIDSVVQGEMENVGKEMAKYCNGLPLALVVLGGILATKSTLDDWKEVQKNIHSCLQDGTIKQDELTILQVLELSYYDLPYYLKLCFLHLGNFPEDYEIPTKRLYYMWAIEGIVAQPRNAIAEELSMEAIAEDYLQELVDRCLVQLGRTGKSGKIRSCHLHDLIRDMCLNKCNEENFLNVIKHGDFGKQLASRSSSSSLIKQRFHRLAIYMHKSSDNLQHLISDKSTHHVRSILFFPAGEVQPNLNWPRGKDNKALNLVRVLHLDDMCIQSLPKEIGGLIHLRYLSLKGTRVSNRPSSIRKLRNLQILDLQVRESINVTIPNVIWKLKRLKHMYLPNDWKVGKGTTATIAIEILPLIFPRSLISVYTVDKLRIGSLIQLNTLVNLRLEECVVEDLEKLTALRKLTLADYLVTKKECLNSFLKCSNIAGGQLKKPLSLALDGNVIDKDPSILVSNSLVCFNILEISGKITRGLGYARIFPRDLKQLTLHKCELADDPMRVLEKLPRLTDLTLGEDSFLGEKMVCTSRNFLQLNILRLVQLTRLAELEVEEGAMPGLENMYIYSCKSLKEIPVTVSQEVKIVCRGCENIQGVER